MDAVLAPEPGDRSRETLHRIFHVCEIEIPDVDVDLAGEPGGFMKPECRVLLSDLPADLAQVGLRELAAPAVEVVRDQVVRLPRTVEVNHVADFRGEIQQMLSGRHVVLVSLSASVLVWLTATVLQCCWGMIWKVARRASRRAEWCVSI